MAVYLVGYSLPWAADVEGIISRLREALTHVIEPAVDERGGGIVKTMCDGLLDDSSSHVLAVRGLPQFGCAQVASNEVRRLQSE